MLETRATIVQIHDGRAMVNANQVSGCEQCNGQGCGSSKVAQLFCSKPRYFEVDNPIAAQPGDEVIVSVADGAVLRGIGLAYLLPIISMVLGAGLASWLSGTTANGDLYVADGGMLGLVIGFWTSHSLAKRLSRSQNRPFVARRWVEIVK
ncbi:MAG: SoxR reducing system RseC family protein [Gallionella sp.]|nr:SoxR reducing system RseC family protein [Gallionella sp.]